MATQLSDAIVERFNQAQDSLVIQAADMSLETIAAMVEVNAIDVQPQYQRRERWSAEAQSALIESFLLNIPVPPVYLAEEDFGNYSVIDGKQRLTTIKRFMREEFPLTRLERFQDLQGMRFSELPVDLRNALRIRPYVRVVTLLKQSDPELKYEVFTRLNSGGMPLQPQEVRNAMFRGPFNDLLIRLSEHPFLRQQLKIRNLKEDAYLSMSDVEYVLRFFTMAHSWRNFSGDYRRSMDLFMAHNRSPSRSKLRAMAAQFEQALDRCKSLWGESAFRRYDIASKTHRDQFLSALYDAQMIAVADLSDSNFRSIEKRGDGVRRATKKLFEHPQFDDAIRVSTNTPSRIKLRIEAVKSLLAVAK